MPERPSHVARTSPHDPIEVGGAFSASTRGTLSRNQGGIAVWEETESSAIAARTGVQTLEPRPWEPLESAIARALQRASETGAWVEFGFNGARVAVDGRDPPAPEHVFARVEEHLEARAAARWAARDDAARVALAQREHHRLVSLSIRDLEESDLVRWLARYTQTVRDEGVRTDPGAVALALEEAGYARDAALGLAREEYEKPEVMAAYIAGQVIDHLRREARPPQVLVRLASHYQDARRRADAGRGGQPGHEDGAPAPF